MKSLKILFALLLLGVAQLSSAALVQIDLEIEISFDETGLYLGETGDGVLVYDDSFLSSSGEETLTPGAGLVSLDINILGLTLTEADDDDFPDYPELFFIDGTFGGLDFIALPALLEGFELGLNNTAMIDFDEYFIDAAITDPQTVPLPAAAWLFSSGLLGLAIARRKNILATN